MHRLARIPTILLTLAAPLACGDAGDAATDTDATSSSASTDDSTPSTSAAESSTGIDPAQLYNCDETMFGASPLAGPGYDPGKGGSSGSLPPIARRANAAASSPA